MGPPVQPTTLKVFISYSHDSPEHADRVLALANRLRGDGIEAILDQYEEFGPPEGWPRWMTRHIRDADFVVMVCTPVYYARVMGEEKPGTGRGVTWEGNLIFQHIYEGDTVNRRFIPVLLQDQEEMHIPDPLRPFVYYRLQEETGYRKLYRRLTNQPLTTAPEVGELKALPARERRQDFFNEPPHNIPLPGPVEFVGRAGALTRLDERLQRVDKPAAITSVAGMGGVGKTELAVRYARSRLNVYPAGVCWAKVRDADLASQVLAFAQIHLRLVPPDTLTDVEARVAYCWAQWPENGRVLLILDDVTSWNAVRQFLPKSSRFNTLITSRKHFGGVEPLELDVLEPKDSLALLESLIRTERCAAQRDEAQALCQWLGHLPLGLELVGRYLAGRKDLSLAEMLSRLQAKGLAHRAIKPGEGLGTAERSVEAAIELSWEELNEDARRLGCLLSLFALAPIPWGIVKACMGNRDAEELENLRDDALLNASLVQRKGENLYQVHQLAREFFRDKLTSLGTADELRAAFAGALARKASEVPQQPTLDILTAFSPLLPHLEALAEHGLTRLEGFDVLWPFVALQRLYAAQSIFSRALDWAKNGLTATRARLGPEHLAVAASLNNLASLYYSQGRYEEAEPLYQQALEMRRKLLGEEHPDVAASLNNLASLYDSQGRYEKAEPLYRQSLEMLRKLLGEKHPAAATSINNLASLYNSQGRYEEAEPLYQQALNMRRKLLGEKHPDVASSLNNLAELYRNRGRYEEAEPLYQQSLDMRRKLLGEEHPDVATSLNNLASLYDSQGRYEEAEPLYQQALEMRRKLLGEEHPDVATSLNNLASLYDGQGRYEEAEPRYRQSLEMWRKLLGEEHPDVATSLNNLAMLYARQGRYQEAEPLYQHALEMRRKLLGEEHPDVASSLNNLAGLYDSQGRYEEAEPRYRQSLEMLRKLLGEEHPAVATSLNNLASLYDSQGRYEEAEPLCQQSLRMRRKLLGEEHPDVASSLNNLAGLYARQGRYQEAEPLYRQSLEMSERVLGVGHPTTNTIRQNLSAVRDRPS
jgi:tetratricopeptide (TPR) repeat protein